VTITDTNVGTNTLGHSDDCPSHGSRVVLYFSDGHRKLWCLDCKRPVKADNARSRGELLRQLFALIDEDGIVDRHKWATVTLNRLAGNEVTTYRSLTDLELRLLIDTLVLTSISSASCTSVGHYGQACVYRWPGHPTFCCDSNGNEWLARSIF
jgi:hypothetical protein